MGVGAKFDGDKLVSVGITCAFCHSTVDDSIMKGAGNRLDGWPNRDLDVGAIVALAPDLTPYQQLLGVDRAAVEKVLKSWGPGRYDAELNQDGKGFRPDGKSAATVLPAAFGLAGVHLHTYTGWGSVTYWNAYVATTQMEGVGTFFDPRIKTTGKFPVGVKGGFDNIRRTPDRVTEKLAPLHFYQLALPPASPMHTPEEIGIDDFQAKRSPDGMYRTTPLRGLFVREKGGFHHDGRFPTYRAVVDHYDGHFRLSLTEAEKNDLIEFLKSL